MDNLISKIEDCKKNSMFKRINSTHPFDIYVGYNDLNQKTLVIIDDSDILPIKSTKCIEVYFTKRQDNRTALNFSLLDDEMSDIFYQFCYDIIEKTNNIKIKNSIDETIKIFSKWSLIFKNQNSSLNENEVKGLIGELLFLKNYMFKKYGITKSLNSWMGCSKTHKDYEINDTWYEIKSIVENALTVKISSLEQLESNKIGFLCTILLSKSNQHVDNFITLNSIINSIFEELESTNDTELFSKKLEEIKFNFSNTYDKYIYEFKNLKLYLVNNDFPKLNKLNIPTEIVRVSYEISINNINKFEVGENNDLR